MTKVCGCAGWTGSTLDGTLPHWSMGPDSERDGGGSRRQRMVSGIVIALAIGLALSLALRTWDMLMVGIGLGVVLWASSGGEG